MKSNFWEEKMMPPKFNEFHDEELKKWDIPKWILEIKCPICQSSLSHRSIRGITLKLNTRNLGDVAVEVLCDSCKTMDTVYFRSVCNNVMGFCDLIGDKSLKPKNTIPLVEEDMYKLQYNNLLEKLGRLENKDAL